ncbi:MAG: transposase [Pseudomonadales bacterium]|nr:transposase [Pseudomonadales bacterium]
MSRPVRIEFPGAHYHVTSRGIKGRPVFLDDEDRTAFLSVLNTVVSRYGWLVHSYVLMNDHYHLVVGVPDANLSKGMRQLNGVYTQHFNRVHGLEGPLFQGRFRSVLFEKDGYLLPLCRHVVLNPVRTGDAKSVHGWKWSSHRAMAGAVKVPPYLHVEDVLSSFGKRPRDQKQKYKEYIREGLREASPLADRCSQVLLGSPRFLNEMKPILNGEKLAKRGPKRARRRRSLSTMFRNIENKTRSERNELIRRAHIEHAYTLMEIGDHLGLHYTTVSKVVNS